jgi:hypothetical protein
MRKNFTKKLVCMCGVSVLGFSTIKAQLTFTGQVRTRTEFRAGQGTLQQKGDVPALFTSQRTRVNAGYTGYRFKFFTAIQDVRVWGQDASTNNRTTTEANNGLLVHEAYGEIILNDTGSLAKVENFSIKLGRQELNYDDQRLLGGLDWLQQARRHDAVVFKFANKGWVADVGGAFNQNAEKAVNNSYNGVPVTSTTNTVLPYPAGTNAIGTMYKSMQFAYLSKTFFFGKISGLFFKDDFSKYQTVGGVKKYDRAVWSRMTAGAYLDATIKRKLKVEASYYHQGGQDKDGTFIDANAVSAAASLQIGRKFFAGPGFDYLSGDDGTAIAKPGARSNRFDPLYGTPHKFWGYMDYFYVASGFGRQGLKDYFFKMKYNAKDNLTFLLDVHAFAAANKVSDGVGGKRDPKLGTEVDFLIRYNLTKLINFELGYCVMEASNTMASAQVKNVANPERTAQWAYLMINIKPNFLAK